MGENNVKDKLSLSSHGSSSGKRSSHGKDEFVSVTVRKEDPNQKAGIRLEAEDNGRIRVTNIALNGLFANSEIQIGDIVLSVNGKRLARGEEPDVLVEVIKNATQKVTLVVKKTNVEPRVAEKIKKDESKMHDNNVKQRDSFYQGLSKHKEDGSFAFTTEADTKEKKKKKSIVSCTISANKEDEKCTVDIDETAGLGFVVQNKLLFVSSISKGSVFQATELQVGDRILSINDCNFRAYADADFASRNVIKSANAVTLVVEKGVEGFTPIPQLSDDAAPVRNKTRARRHSNEKLRRSISREKKKQPAAGAAAADEATKPLRRKLKNVSAGGAGAGAQSDDSNDGSQSDEASFGGEEDDIAAELGLPLARSNYKELVIAAPKAFSAQEVGVLFETMNNRYVVVKEVQEGSIFTNTSLEAGDIVLQINDVDFRTKPDHSHAWKTCKKTQESVTMLVLKEDAHFKQQIFNLDSSVSNLHWQ